MQTKTVQLKPCTAPTVEQLAKMIASSNDQPLPLKTNKPFQHMEEIFLFSIYHDTDTTPQTYDISKKSPRSHSWNRGDWNYLGFEVVLARHPDAHDAIWGIDSDGGADYFGQTIHDLCAEIMYRVNGGPVGDLAPVGYDINADYAARNKRANLDVDTARARSAELDAQAQAALGHETAQDAEKTWKDAKAAIHDVAAKENALLALRRDREIVELARANARIDQSNAELAYSNGAPRPLDVPFFISGCILQLDRYLGRVEWMIQDVEKA